MLYAQMPSMKPCIERSSTGLFFIIIQSIFCWANLRRPTLIDRGPDSEIQGSTFESEKIHRIHKIEKPVPVDK